jgi:hypothetical protein
MNPKIIVIVLIALAVLGGGFYFYQNSKKTTDTAEEKTTSTSEEPTNTPTPDEVDKTAFTIEIQNGSGIAGEAGRAQELLEGDDFKVESTANAENYDYKETVIQAGADVDEEWLDLLKETLEQNYTVESKVEELPEGSETDVIVIVGSFDDKGESMATEEEKADADVTPTEGADTTTTPSPSPSPSPTP